MTFVDSIYQFNLDAGLLDKGYNDFLESSFQIEEALEGFNKPAELLFDEYGNVVIDAINSAGTKELSRDIVSWMINTTEAKDISDVDRLDKACDAVVFAIGSMAKLGLTPDQIEEAMYIVTDANLQKLSMPKDEHGKLTKPSDFVGPEPKLQALLDRRNS